MGSACAQVALRTGAVAVRDLKAAADVVQLDEGATALVIEVAAAAGLLATWPDPDGNPATEADTAWTSLLALPPYPDEPSGANCAFGGFMNSAKAFFGSDAAEFDITSPGPAPGTGSTRHYSHFTDVIPDMINARVYGGLHFRRADVNGAILGHSVADYVDRNFFNCGPSGQCKQEGRQ